MGAQDNVECKEGFDDLSVISSKDINVTNVRNNLNVMTLTWLTPINTYNKFLFSINKGRYSANQLHEGSLFGLQVPMKSWKDRILTIGSVTGEYFKGYDSNSSCEAFLIDDEGVIVCHLSEKSDERSDSKDTASQMNTSSHDSTQDKNHDTSHITSQISSHDSIHDTSHNTSQKKYTKISKESLLSMGYEGIISRFGKKRLKHKNHIIYHLYHSKFDLINVNVHHVNISNLSKKRYKNYPLSQAPQIPFLEGCCAYLMCGVVHVDANAEQAHNIVHAEILDSYVLPRYWKDGKQFIPLPDDPYLTFLGTQEFAYVTTFD